MTPEDWINPERLARLVDSHGPRVHGYLARRAPSEADDLLAEVWATAFAQRHTFDPGRGEIGGWLFGIARNLLMAHYRRVRRLADVASPQTESASEAEDQWAAVDDRLDAISATATLRTALAAMPADEREVLLLVAWEQLSPTEAAAVLGIPAGTARSRLHRARTRLSRSATPDPSTPSRPTDSVQEALS